MKNKRWILKRTNKNNKKVRRGPDSKTKMRYFKISLCRKFV